MDRAVVCGYGEMGKPIAQLLRAEHDVFIVDPALGFGNALMREGDLVADSLHICFPYTTQFITEVVEAINVFRPSLTFIHSTVAPGTTQTIITESGTDRVAHTACHGLHRANRMRADMLNYQKNVGCDLLLFDEFKKVLMAMGHPKHQIRWLNPMNAEYAKLFATTYYGMLIAFAQEVERAKGVSDWHGILDVVQQTEGHLHIGDIYPGVVRGHCVIPNLELLGPSLLTNFVHESNVQREIEEIV